MNLLDFLRSVKATPTLIETGERPESFLGKFIVDKPVAINNIVEEIRKFAINKRNWAIKNNVLCCLQRECLLPYFWPDARKQKHSLNRQRRMAGLLRPWIPLHSRNWLFTAAGPILKLLRWTGTGFTPTFTISYSKIDGCISRKWILAKTDEIG